MILVRNGIHVLAHISSLGVAKPQVLKSESLLACDIVFVSMQLYPDPAVPLMFAM